MKTVFVFGAGASQEAGAPLMQEFMDKAEDLFLRHAVEDAQKQFELVFTAMSDFQAVHAKSYLDLDNLEVVFGAIEMGLLVKRLGKRSFGEIRRLRDAFVTVIYKTLEQSIHFSDIGGKVWPPRPYDKFAEILAKIFGERAGIPIDVAFITFNYDICLDYALGFKGIHYDYGFEPRSPHVFPLLKLHGSINWGRDSRGGLFVHPVRPDEVYFGDYLCFPCGTRIAQETKKPPMIVPPTWNKKDYHGQLTKVWTSAAAELAEAANIVVIGYSMPETDSFFRYLYALGSLGNTRIRNFIVINPEDEMTGSVRKRFEDLIGRGIHKKFTYIPKTFSEALGDIKDLLRGQPVKKSRIIS